MWLHFGGDDDWCSPLEDPKYAHETEDEDTDAGAEGDPDPEYNLEDSPLNPDVDPEDDPWSSSCFKSKSESSWSWGYPVNSSSYILFCILAVSVFFKLS